MQAESVLVPDWRDPAAYAPLLDADRSLFAWEWLRRDLGYCVAAEKALSRESPGAANAGAERFGLVAFEAPQLAVPHARPFWRSDIHPFVLTVDAGGRALSSADAIEVDPTHGLAWLIVDDGAERLLLSDGLRAIRLDGPPGTFSAGPVCLRYAIEGLVSAEPPLLTLRRFLALCRTGDFSRSLHRRETRARRWIMMVRAHDALIAGADQRQVAREIFSRSVGERCWRAREPSVRSQVQRLVRSARRFAAGDYRSLLR